MHYLVADRLVLWLVKQKEVSCGSRSVIKAHYNALDAIDNMFEKCGREVVVLIGILTAVEQMLTPEDIVLSTQIQKHRPETIQACRQFIWQSLIVAVQPPAVLVKCRGSDSHRSTRFPCKTEIRLLGGEALGLRQSATNVRVELIR
jgi:hypothetical protein